MEFNTSCDGDYFPLTKGQLNNVTPDQTSSRRSLFPNFSSLGHIKEMRRDNVLWLLLKMAASYHNAVVFLILDTNISSKSKR